MPIKLTPNQKVGREISRGSHLILAQINDIFISLSESMGYVPFISHATNTLNPREHYLTDHNGRVRV